MALVVVEEHEHYQDNDVDCFPSWKVVVVEVELLLLVAAMAEVHLRDIL